MGSMCCCLSKKKDSIGYIKLDTLGQFHCKNYDLSKECIIPEDEEIWGILNSHKYLFNNIESNYGTNDDYLKFFDSIQNIERFSSHYKLCCKEKDIYAYSIELRSKWHSLNKQIIKRMFLKISLECESMNLLKEKILEQYKKKLEAEKSQLLKKFVLSDEFKEKLNTMALLNDLEVPDHEIIDDSNQNNNNNGGNESELLELEF